MKGKKLKKQECGRYENMREEKGEGKVILFIELSRGQNIGELGNTLFVTIKSYSHEDTVHTECFSLVFITAHVTFYKVKQ